MLERSSGMDELLKRFNAARVRYLLAGGQSMRLAGMPRFSMDWDFFIPPRDEGNLARLNEVLAVLLMAAKFGVPVCPHAGGVGLCEYVQHISLIDYLCVSGTLENRVTEFADHLHEHFINPVVLEKARYRVPVAPGYSITMHSSSLDQYEFPNGSFWRELATSRAS